MAAKAHDVDLSHSGAENSEKSGERARGWLKRLTLFHLRQGQGVINSSAAIPHRTLAVILIGRNAHVCSKIVTRTIMNITCNASGSESKKQYGNQLFHLSTLSAR
jgi:hypothetical protein